MGRPDGKIRPARQVSAVRSTGGTRGPSADIEGSTIIHGFVDVRYGDLRDRS
jgi:hypothetical protein